MHKYLIPLAVAALAALPACNKETTASASGKELTLAVKSDQAIEQGQTDSVLVTVNRDNFEGPISVDFSNLPAGITVKDPGSINADDSMRTYTLQASPTAAPIKEQRVTVTVRGGGLTVSEDFMLTVDRNEDAFEDQQDRLEDEADENRKDMNDPNYPNRNGK